MTEPIDRSVEHLIDQLEALRAGQPDLDVRVASIRALAKIAASSDEHRPAIVGVLSAYICQNARGGRPDDPRR